LRAKNIRVLAMWEAGFRQLTTKKPVNIPADVKGMKVRVAKNQVYLWLWSALGANPTVIPFGETYISLQQGVVDAQETPINTIQVNKFYEVTKFINLTNHIYGPQPLGVTDRRWQSFTAEDQAAIQKAGQEASTFHRKAVLDEDSGRLAEMKAKGAVVITPDVPAFGKASRPVYDKASEKFPKDVLRALLKDADAIKSKYPVK
jgi:tripartite ATP-independent transporter DctP family solute receptor